MARIGDRIELFENGRFIKRAANDLHRDRVRFNWGYHDGASEERRRMDGDPDPARRVERNGEDWRERHHDPVYVEGHNAGAEDMREGRYNQNSDAAWAATGRTEADYDEVTLFRHNIRKAAFADAP